MSSPLGKEDEKRPGDADVAKGAPASEASPPSSEPPSDDGWDAEFATVATESPSFDMANVPSPIASSPSVEASAAAEEKKKKEAVDEPKASAAKASDAKASDAKPPAKEAAKALPPVPASEKGLAAPPARPVPSRPISTKMPAIPAPPPTLASPGETKAAEEPLRKMHSSIPDDYDAAATSVMEVGGAQPVPAGTPISAPAVPAAARAAPSTPKTPASKSTDEEIPRVYEDSDDPDDAPTTVGTGHAFGPPVDLDEPIRAPSRSRPEAPAAAAPRPKYPSDADTGSLPRIEEPPDVEETRALPREDLVRPPSGHQDAHVVVGSGAVGDEATLAVPASIDANERARALASLGIEEPPTFPAPKPPPAAPPPAVSPQASSGGHPAALPWGQTPQPHGATVALPGPPVQPAAPPQPRAPFGPFPMSPHAAHPPQPIPPPPPPWEQTGRRPPAPPKLSSQIILLAVVGVVCLGIFATGIYLFVTTNF